MQEYITRHHTVLSGLLLALIMGASFYIGYTQGKGTQNSEVSVSYDSQKLAALAVPTEKLAEGKIAVQTGTGKYVGSKNGTKYYDPSCGSVKRIKPENYRWFESAQEAMVQGYTLGKC